MSSTVNDASPVGGGEDSLEQQYESVEELWANERSAWYKRTIQYWMEQEASVSGVLAGHTELHAADVRDSRDFLSVIGRLPEEKGGPPGFEATVDCGAGIGRVTKHVLLKHFKEVDLVEPIAKYVETARNYVDSPRLKNCFCTSLQDFEVPPDRYDVVWAQWCLLYLTDEDVVAFIKNCRRNMRAHGVIVVKENISSDASTFYVDREDNSLMRSAKHYRQLFEKADVQVILEREQKMFPKHLFPVRMFCLR